MSNVIPKVTKLQNAQHRVNLLARNTEAFLLEPELLATVLEELSVVLEEIDQQYNELLSTRQALEEQRQRYQELFDFAPEGYLVTDIRGVIQEANQAAETLFGVRRNFLVGKPLSLFVAKLDRRAFFTYLSALQTSAQQRNWDLRLKPQRGEVFPAVIATSAVYSPDSSKLLGWRWLLRDITALRHSTVITRESVGEEKLDHLRSSFIQMISHELRTPMTVIVTALELLKHRTDANPVQRQTYIERIQQATWRMNTLLNDVLLYDDTEANTRSLTPTQLDLEAFCQEIITRQQARADKPHTVTVSSDGTCEAVYLDQERMQQMLDRLVANALNYSPPNTPVSLDLQCMGDCIGISIHNEGTPLDQAQQSHLFEPFYRPESSAHIPGVGLGLTIVKRAVDAYNGELTVESNTETGITFKVTLPKLNVEEKRSTG